MNAYFDVRQPQNEKILGYREGSPEKAEIKDKIKELKSQKIEIPLIIGGKEVYTGNTKECIIPHDKGRVLGVFHQAGEKEVELAVKCALEARKEWEKMPWQHRIAIFLKAAELLAGPWRQTINAATMLCQSKTVYQAEIDSACELIDFLRFNSYFVTDIYKDQPMSTEASWNRVEYRPLEGFVFAVTPFNFTSIGGNLPIAPAMTGNVVLWKPASSAVYSNYYVMKMLQEAGLPDGVINFIPGSGAQVGDPVLKSRDLAGIHFTGSTGVFSSMWTTIGENIRDYKYYPRIIGETGGKDFIFAHNAANVDQLSTAIVRGAFEYQGQKCSAASRAYIPRSIWGELKEKMIDTIKTIKMGDPEDFTNFMSAVIDQKAYDSIKGYIDFAKDVDDAEILIGGTCDDSKGFFVEPTVILTQNPSFKTMVEEIFGPVITIYVYEDDDFEDTLKKCDESSPYALTGAIFSKDRMVISMMERALTNVAGNFYINDKPTGAVVGQQPFGGGRASGTNDKAGSKLNLMRWMSARTIKETFVAPVDYRYPFMENK